MQENSSFSDYKCNLCVIPFCVIFGKAVIIRRGENKPCQMQYTIWYALIYKELDGSEFVYFMLREKFVNRNSYETENACAANDRYKPEVCKRNTVCERE